MRTFRARRWRNLAVLFAVGLLVAFAVALLTVSLRPSGFYTGWVLFGGIVVLAAYNLFKKVPFLNLGSSSGWLQFTSTWAGSPCCCSPSTWVFTFPLSPWASSSRSCTWASPAAVFWA